MILLQQINRERRLKKHQCSSIKRYFTPILFFHGMRWDYSHSYLHIGTFLLCLICLINLLVGVISRHFVYKLIICTADGILWSLCIHLSGVLFVTNPIWTAWNFRETISCFYLLFLYVNYQSSSNEFNGTMLVACACLWIAAKWSKWISWLHSAGRQW